MGSEVQEKGGAHDRARIVRRYLSALDARKPGRSSARTVEAVQHRMHQIDTLLLSADPVQRLHLTQERIDLHAEQLRLQTSNGGDFEALEKAFIRVARAYGDRHAVTYSAWRQVGVDGEVLATAGIHPQAKPQRQVTDAKADAASAAAGTDAATKGPGAASSAAEPVGGGTAASDSTQGAPTKKPAAQAEKPAAQAEKPAAQAEKPAAQTEKPAAQAKKPAAAKQASVDKKPQAAKKPTAAAGNGAAGNGTAGGASTGNGAAVKKAPAKKKPAAAAKAEAAKPEQQQLPAEAHLLS